METQNYIEHGHLQMLKEIKHTVHRHLHLHQLTPLDLTPPTYLVELSCGVNTDPASIAALKDSDSRPQPASSTNIGAYYDDYAQTPTVVELNEVTSMHISHTNKSDMMEISMHRR